MSVWFKRGSLVLAAGMAALIATATGPGGAARAATATETGFVVPGAVHRGNGQALHAPNAAGMPATVADFLAGRGHGAATVASLRVKRVMAVQGSGASVVDLTQEVQGLAVYGVRLRAIFDGDGNLTTLSENLVSVGPVVPAAIGPRAALDAALDEVHPGRAFGLIQRGAAGNSTGFGGDDFFFKDPSVTRVAISQPGQALQEGFLVETWSDDDNQLNYTLVGGNGQVLNVESRTNNACVDVFKDCYNVFTIHPGSTVQTYQQGPGTGGNAESPDGWLTGSQSATDICGNNVHAYLDHDDLYTNQNGQFPSTSCNGTTIDLDQFLADAEFTKGPLVDSNPDVAIQNLFYLNNVIHDTLYGYGFTESVGNFQEDNFENGGRDGDSVNAEAQDGGGTNNANFATPTDGNNPRMQMYLWDGKPTHLVTVGASVYDAMGAVFGAEILEGAPVAAATAAASPLDACDPLTNDLTGQIALIDRGGCDFVVKVKNAQNAGAIGAIVVNNQGNRIFTMGGSDNSINIPSVLVGQDDGGAIAGFASLSVVAPPPVMRDGDLDGDIVQHEYGHGLTWRIIGNMNGLQAAAIGEGMSDALAFIMSNDPVIGEYSTSYSGGIRSEPYDTWESTGRDYDDWVGQEHADGEIYGAIIWKMWELYSNDGTIAAPQNQIMVDLVDGMKVISYQFWPTFVDMRDSILFAISGESVPETPGLNQNRWCHAWEAFAKYGVGTDQVTTQTRRGIRVTLTWTSGFAVPDECAAPVADVADPTVTITTPDVDPFATGSATVDFAGTAGDDIGVTSVTWVNSTGGSGTASGTDTWSISSIGLVEGDNVISVTAHDAAGKSSAVDQLTVTYTPVVDAANPTVTITTPGVDPFATGSSTVDFAGTASDDIGVTSVTWANSTGGSGTATGTDNWSISSIGLVAGDNVISVMAHDAAGKSSVVDQLTVTYTPSGATSMHVGDLDGIASVGRRGKWNVEVIITIHDDSHALVDGATVSGTWSNGAKGGASCTTVGGTCSVTKANIKSTVGSVTFTVTGVTGSLTYVDPDPATDPDGTAITVLSP